MKELVFEQALDKITFEQYVSYIESMEDRIKRVDKHIKTTAENERYAEKVRCLRAFKGIDYITALSVVVEVGDFRRFASAEGFMSYLGLVPREYSSGKKRQMGPITKMGSSHLRKLLTESAWHYTRPVYVGRRLAERRIGTDEEIWTLPRLVDTIKRLALSKTH
jgi:transposase